MKISMRFKTAITVPIVLAGALAFRAAPVITIYLAGDSTMAAKETNKRPETGWGESLQACFAPSGVRVVNRAMNGRSTKSFAAEGRWKAIVDSLKPGDFVVIQFGHNDEKVTTPIGASPAEYRANLSRFVDEVREKDATPILMTPIARRAFVNDTIVDSHGAYPDVVRKLRKDKKVPFVDMLPKSEQLIAKYGQDSSAVLYLHLGPGEHTNYPAGVQDDTHLSPLGAREIAGIFVDAIRQMGLGLREHLRSCPARA